MIHAIPFDLRLLTAVDDGAEDWAAYFEAVFRSFGRYRDWLLAVNRRLQENPQLGSCRLMIPMTERLDSLLCNTPPWSEVNRSDLLRQLKVQVLNCLLGLGHGVSPFSCASGTGRSSTATK
jgi:hypothetical protein